MASGAERTLHRFGPFELDLPSRELRRQGTRVPLPAQPATVLACLVTRAGDLVTREELHALVWPAGTFVDFERGLNFCINRIRRALGDSARPPVYVQTLPGRGYRFIAAVTTVAPMPRSTQTWTVTPRAPRPPWGWRLTVLGLALGGLLVLPHGAGVRTAERPRARRSEGPARTAYLKGLYQGRLAGGALASLAALEESARLDPGDPDALAALAQAWVREVQEGRVAPRAGMPRARDAAARALRLDDLAAAHLVLGTVALRYEWDWPAAERHLRRALALAPSAEAQLELADLLLVRGRPAEAVRAAEAAEEIDPVCPTVGGRLAGSYYAARRFDDAAETLRRATAVAPDLVGRHERLFHAYRHGARPREAVEEAMQVMALVGIAPSPRMRRESADRAMESFVRGSIAYFERDARRAPALVADHIAVLHAALGQGTDALRWLRVAATERSTTLPVTLATDPDLDALREDPAFRALLRELSLS
jgi:DNA-binding winged helix-turn-helix (wHTH) protein/tetratricopeptide (TPR) repeat protein